MARNRLSIGFAVLALLSAAGCTVKEQKTPGLTGPSGAGISLQVQITPDTIFQDGASQALVTITAFDSNGQPLRNLPLRAEIVVDNTITDFGTLSARNIVTDANGKATITFTAPPPVQGVSSTQIVDIVVRPTGTNFDNSTSKSASVRLVPQGVIGPGTSPFRPLFAPPTATVGDPAIFQASVTDATGADVSNQIVSFFWDFGDGRTATGQTVSHTFTSPGTFAVTLRVVDLLGRTAQVTQTMTVGPGVNPTPSFTVSPAPPAAIGQVLTFNATASTAAPGHSITSYDWDFGDGSFASGVTATHAYNAAGTYVVILTVRDDVGRKATSSQSVVVATAGPTASFTFSPSQPSTGQTITFDASTSRPANGRTIRSYAWNFDDGTTGTGVTTTHAYSTAGTYRVLLTVTDDIGQVGQTTQNVTVK